MFKRFFALAMTCAALLLGSASPAFAADLTITAASVVKGSNAVVKHGTAGAAVTAGQAVYYDSAAGTWKLADDNSATVAARTPQGFALHAAATGQPLAVHTGGDLTVGATLTAGVAYYLSDTPGGICPAADLASGEYPTIVGIAKSTSVLAVSFQSSGVAL
jgi:hypothetical protein